MLAETLIALFSLIALEVILGIDNIIFISILADKLPEKQKGQIKILGYRFGDAYTIMFVRSNFLDSKVGFRVV
jgi:predicted tellurium resistance membrane protein TerC